MKKVELTEIIRHIVREELSTQLPSMLSEMYLKKIVAESVGHVDEMIDEDVYEEDDEIPTMLQNSDNGIYQQSPLFRDDNPLRELYTNIKQPTAADRPTPGVPFDRIGEIIKRTQKTLGKMEESKSMNESTSAEEFERRRLENYRRELDSKIVK